jgi:hypothetical protein
VGLPARLIRLFSVAPVQKCRASSMPNSNDGRDMRPTISPDRGDPAWKPPTNDSVRSSNNRMAKCATAAAPRREARLGDSRAAGGVPCHAAHPLTIPESISGIAQQDRDDKSRTLIGTAERVSSRMCGCLGSGGRLPVGANSLQYGTGRWTFLQIARRRRRYAAVSCSRRASTLLGSGRLAG